MYHLTMKKITLRKKIENSKLFKNDSSIRALLSGSRFPSYSKAIILENKFNIPISAWKDIKSFITNHTQSVTKKNDKNKVYEEKE